MTFSMNAIVGLYSSNLLEGPSHSQALSKSVYNYFCIKVFIWYFLVVNFYYNFALRKGK